MSDSTRVNGKLAESLPGLSTTRKRTLLARPSVAFLASFPPRECGIATFTRDLLTAVESTSHLRKLTRLAGPSPWVIAMTESGQSYEYSSQVRATIDRDIIHQYREAAERVNASGRTQVVCIQHEYGLYGGDYGDYLLEFIRNVQRPVVLTMHTVLERPDPLLRLVTENLINESAAVVVLAERAREIIGTYYRRANLDKVTFIPHGTPRVRHEPTQRFKHELGLDGYTLLSTFGLLGPDKGIEYAIRALPDIVARHPDVLYLVLGETHPSQRRRVGEEYRQMLLKLVDELGMQQYVRFYDHYLNMEELLRFLQATDVYVMPYLNPHQIVSGTLAYAVACGKSVVATPFVYAQEMLAEGRGMLANVANPESLSAAITAILDDPQLKAQMEVRAYNHGRRMHWPAVGVAYCRLFRRVAEEHHAEVHSRDTVVRLRRMVRASRKAGVAAAAAAASAPAAMRPVAMSRPLAAPPAVASGLAGAADSVLGIGQVRRVPGALGALEAGTATGEDGLLSAPLS